VIRRSLLALSIVVGPGAAVAQQGWSVELPGTAVSENESGYRFTVESGPSRYSADCRLTLPDASDDSLAGDSLVSLQVDANEPLTVLRWQGQPEEEDDGDFFEVIRRTAGGVPRTGMSERWISFRCWSALPGQESPATGALREILDGSELVLRFSTVSGGAQETALPLAGAREAITEALRIQAAPTPRDVAQAELLRFRYDYRSHTCYLLHGRKRQKRCLEAVDQCAEQVHDSVLSMLECIEGK
jgi:hypothetical protein